MLESCSVRCYYCTFVLFLKIIKSHQTLTEGQKSLSSHHKAVRLISAQFVLRDTDEDGVMLHMIP